MSKRLPNFLQGDTPERLLRATTTERDRVLLMVFLYLGLRVSELSKLRVEHIDFRAAALLVFQGKGGKDRLLPLPKRFAGVLRGWVGARAEGYVFPSRRGGPLKPRAIQLLVKRVALAAGLPGALEPKRYHPHTLRHTMATRMLDRTDNLIAVRDALGHASVATTQIYTHLTGERLRQHMEI